MPFNKLLDNSPALSDISSGLACDAAPGDVLAWMSGHHILRLSREHPAFAEVLDGSGNIIGQADRLIYGRRGWAVHTKNFAGFVPNHQVRIMED
jgi:hypothetical protein